MTDPTHPNAILSPEDRIHWPLSLLPLTCCATKKTGHPTFNRLCSSCEIWNVVRALIPALEDKYAERG